jgi:tetratricopeptide (TPR) repeat protein
VGTGISLLVEYFEQIPERSPGESAVDWRRRYQASTETFRKQVAARYTENTLLRLLNHGDSRARRAALVALEFGGTLQANLAIAARLHDDDLEVRRLADNALWSIWFRADTEENNKELRRLSRLRSRDQALIGLTRLIDKAPKFAEAYNQRAILYFRLKQFERSIADCERTLSFNPCHFGAQAGMAQCYLNLRKHRAALKAFRHALRLNPSLEGVADTIRALENALGESRE